MGKLRNDKFEAMERGLSSQQNIFKKLSSDNEAGTVASLRVLHELAKRGKPFSDGELVESCMIRVQRRFVQRK
ncbi:hypothetical protein ANN_08854 [Periplaneta americana]|uniref:Uncharacterized protein n=1 Tax=Periplaneta americana TaxID=6978 RepID=A0ABQ8T3R6_PERAM|nr:hypothetical protein ANN_08854 [Periplaneta americana]